MKSNRGRLPRIVLMLVLVTIPVFVVAFYWLVTFPDVAALAGSNPATTALIESRRHTGSGPRKQEWIWVPLSRVSPHLQRAVIIAEDASFYQHEGFDWDGIRQAAMRDLEEGAWRQGGSTITQQVAKNLYLSTEKSMLRKLREALITRELEHHLTKKRILEIYLNIAEWGRGVYGAEAAARHHFGKSAASLTAEEAALLAAILPAPRRHDPLRRTRHLTSRQRHILAALQRKPEGSRTEDGTDRAARVTTRP